MENQQTLDISWEAIGKVLVVGLSLYLFFLARNIAVWFLFALVISLLMEPAINFLHRLRIPRILAVVLIYISIPGALGLIIWLTAPMFIQEINQLSRHIPEYFERINPIAKNIGFEMAHNFEDFTAGLVAQLQESSDSVLRAIIVFFGGIYSTFVIFTLAFFLSLKRGTIEETLALLTPKRYESQVISFFERAQLKVSGWFGARVLASVLVGIVSFGIFFLLNIQYAFILALISGVLNFIPYIGPTITLALAVIFVGVSNSWLVAFYIFIALLAIQEIEAKILTPILMKKFMDLPPVLVMLSLLVGHALLGFLGMIFAVPVSGIIYEFLREFLQKRRQDQGA